MMRVCHGQFNSGGFCAERQSRTRGIYVVGLETWENGSEHHVQSSSSRMRVMNHNWSATKQRLHPQSVAEISRHSVLSGDRIRQCGTSSGSRHKDTDQCLKVMCNEF